MVVKLLRRLFSRRRRKRQLDQSEQQLKMENSKEQNNKGTGDEGDDIAAAQADVSRPDTETVKVVANEMLEAVVEQKKEKTEESAECSGSHTDAVKHPQAEDLPCTQSDEKAKTTENSAKSPETSGFEPRKEGKDEEKITERGEHKQEQENDEKPAETSGREMAKEENLEKEELLKDDEAEGRAEKTTEEKDLGKKNPESGTFSPPSDSFYDLCIKELEVALTAEGHLNSSIVSRLFAWKSPLGLDSDQKDALITKLISCLHTTTARGGFAEESGGRDNAARDDAYSLVCITYKLINNFNIREKDEFLKEWMSGFVDSNQNVFPKLDKFWDEFQQSLTGLINNLGDHQIINQNMAKFEKDRDELYWLLLLNPEEVLFRVYTHCIQMSTLTPTVNKIFAQFPSLLNFGTVNRQPSRPPHDEPILISVIWRIFENEPARWMKEEQRDNFIYVACSLTKTKRHEHNPELAAMEDEFNPPPSLLLLSDLYCLFVQQVILIPKQTSLLMILKMLYKLFRTRNNERVTLVDWCTDLGEDKDGSKLCAPELLVCLLEVLSDTRDENYELWQEARDILKLFGHRLTSDRVEFAPETRDFILNRLNEMPWWVKLAITHWFMGPLDKPKVQLPPAIYLTQHTLYQLNSERLALAFEASPSEDFLKSIFELALFDPGFALEFLEKGLLHKPTDPDLITKIGLALVDAVSDNLATATRIVKLAPILGKLVELLDPYVKTSGLPAVNSLNAAIFTGIAKISHLIIYCQAVKMAFHMFEQNVAKEGEDTNKSLHLKTVANTLLLVYCDTSKNYFEQEVAWLKRSERKEKAASQATDLEAISRSDSADRDEQGEQEDKGKEKKIKMNAHQKREAEEKRKDEEALSLVKSRLDEFSAVECVEVQVRKVFADVCILTHIIADLNINQPMCLRILMNNIIDHVKAIESKTVLKSIDLLQLDPIVNRKVVNAYAKPNTPQLALDLEVTQAQAQTHSSSFKTAAKSVLSSPIPTSPVPATPLGASTIHTSSPSKPLSRNNSVSSMSSAAASAFSFNPKATPFIPSIPSSDNSPVPPQNDSDKPITSTTMEKAKEHESKGIISSAYNTKSTSYSHQTQSVQNQLTIEQRERTPSRSSNSSFRSAGVLVPGGALKRPSDTNISIPTPKASDSTLLPISQVTPIMMAVPKSGRQSQTQGYNKKERNWSMKSGYGYTQSVDGREEHNSRRSETAQERPFKQRSDFHSRDNDFTRSCNYKTEDNRRDNRGYSSYRSNRGSFNGNNNFSRRDEFRDRRNNEAGFASRDRCSSPSESNAGRRFDHDRGGSRNDPWADERGAHDREKKRDDGRRSDDHDDRSTRSYPQDDKDYVNRRPRGNYNAERGNRVNRGSRRDYDSSTKNEARERRNSARDYDRDEGRDRENREGDYGNRYEQRDSRRSSVDSSESDWDKNGRQDRDYYREDSPVYMDSRSKRPDGRRNPANVTSSTSNYNERCEEQNSFRSHPKQLPFNQSRGNASYSRQGYSETDSWPSNEARGKKSMDDQSHAGGYSGRRHDTDERDIMDRQAQSTEHRGRNDHNPAFKRTLVYLGNRKSFENDTRPSTNENVKVSRYVASNSSHQNNYHGNRRDGQVEGREHRDQRNQGYERPQNRQRHIDADNTSNHEDFYSSNEHFSSDRGKGNWTGPETREKSDRDNRDRGNGRYTGRRGGGQGMKFGNVWLDKGRIPFQ